MWFSEKRSKQSHHECLILLYELAGDVFEDHYGEKDVSYVAGIKSDHAIDALNRSMQRSLLQKGAEVELVQLSQTDHAATCVLL